MKNKVALVVGAGNNLGAAIARCFSSEDYTVVAARRSGDKLITLQKEIELIEIKIDEDLKKGVMPDLRGINLEDALYLLGINGIKVKVSGSGIVVKQSIEIGESILIGSIIKLELA